MKAILLAGGRGTRISRYIKDLPKCCLPIGKKPLIRITVELMLEKGIEVAVCTGYKQEEVHKALKGLKVTYYHNPFYNVTNSIATLWFAKEFINDSTIIMNSDVYLDQKILDKVIKSNYDCVMATDSSKCESGDYFFKTKKDGTIIKYGKTLTLKERSCEYIGIGKIHKKFIKPFNSQLVSLVNSGKSNLWWENIVYSLSDQGKTINTIDFAGIFWSEVDYYDEYLTILKHCNKTNG